MTKTKKKTWQQLNPQQEAYLQCYLDPKSPTWGNATQSALKAGYSQEYALNITGILPKWLSEALSDNSLINKAMNNLSEFIGNQPDKTIRWDATKFVLTTLGKNKFSSRSEITGPEGKDLIPNGDIEKKASEAVEKFLKIKNPS